MHQFYKSNLINIQAINFNILFLSFNIEIKSLTGESNYRSVNLTWEIDEAINTSDKKDKRNFVVYYCEIQTWGPNRCKSKTLKDEKLEPNRKEKLYSLLIDNLRMATKYSFHIKKQNKPGEQKISGRDFNEDDLKDNGISESIIIPTKGCKLLFFIQYTIMIIKKFFLNQNF